MTMFASDISVNSLIEKQVGGVFIIIFPNKLCSRLIVSKSLF